jgi:hypothetical protein
VDSLSLIDQCDNIIDFVAWGADPGSNDDSAVAVGQWADGTFVNTSNLLENETLGRNKYSSDTDTKGDWENSTTNKAAPYGINATAPTPGKQNIDHVIPEFEYFAIPILVIALLFFCFNRYNISFVNSKSKSKKFSKSKLTKSYKKR